MYDVRHQEYGVRYLKKRYILHIINTIIYKKKYHEVNEYHQDDNVYVIYI